MMDEQTIVLVIIGLAGVVAALTVYLLLKVTRGGSSGTTRGQYTNCEKIAEGGHATVWKAYNPGARRRCALKILKTSSVKDPVTVSKFRQEAEETRKLIERHPDAPIIRVYDSGNLFLDDGELPYMEMEYIAGGSLAHYLDQHGRLSEADAEKVVVQIVRALTVAHQARFVHRDLKPENILLRDFSLERAVVCDFGVAKRMAATPRTVGADFFSLDYSAPEQYSSQAEIGFGTDVYSLGALWYRMLSGTVLFPNPDSLSRIDDHKETDPGPRIQENIPAKYRGLIGAMLRKNMNDRPGLQEVLAGISREARELPASIPVEEQAPPPAVDSPLGRALIASAAGLAIVVGGYMLQQSSASSRVQRPSAPPSQDLVSRSEQPSPPGGGSAGVSARPPAVATTPPKLVIPLTTTEPTKGSLTIGGRPSGASVTIDGKRVASLPGTVSLNPGTYTVKALAANHLSATREVTVKAGRPSTVDFDLVPEEGKLTVTVSENNKPSWGTVRVDGQTVGEAPVLGLKIGAGDHEVLVSSTGFSPQRARIAVQGGEHKKIRIDLVTGQIY